MILHNNIPKPAPLKPGDTVAIVAPSGVVLPEPIEKAEEILQQWGLQVIIGNHIFDQNGMMAGHDDCRLLDFQQMLDNHHVRAIFCARGGYGMMRIIDKMDFTQFSNFPKWIIGFSDITVLHSALNKHELACSIHSVMPNSFSTTETQSLTKLHDLLFTGESKYQIPPHRLNRQGNAEGQLVGGNLSMIYALRGTKYDISFKNKILFIEDIGEKLYHVDRMMQNLRLSGILDELAGLIIGQFTDMSEGSRSFGKTAYEIIAESVSRYTYPACFDFPSGHTQLNVPLFLGNNTYLTVCKENVILRQ